MTELTLFSNRYLVEKNKTVLRPAYAVSVALIVFTNSKMNHLYAFM